MREREVRLGHADWQRPHASLGQPVDPFLTFRQELDIRRTVKPTGEGLDLLTDRRRRWIDRREVAAVSRCALHCFLQADAPVAAPGEAVIDDRAIRAALHRQVGSAAELTLRIAGISVDRNESAPPGA